MAKNLKVVSSATSGFDHMDFDLCNKNNISSFYAPNANAQSAAEHTLSLILTLAKNIIPAYEGLKTNDFWKKNLNPSFEFKDKTLGVIGMGRIGKKVAHFCEAIGMKIIYYDPYLSAEEYKALNFEQLGLTELLKLSDVVTLHAPLTKETHHIINKVTLSEMPTSAYIINAARGKLVQEQHLEEALREKKLAGAALDVFNKEPLPRDSALKTRDNLVLSPHIGAHTEEAFLRSSMESVNNIINHFNNKNSIALPNGINWL